MVKTTVYFSDEQMATLDVRARREARSRAEILRDALDAYAETQATSLPKAVGIFEDYEVDSSNIDDWLQANWRP